VFAVYGDRKSAWRGFTPLARGGAPLDTHAQLVTRLIEAGQLAQGVADARGSHQPELDAMLLDAASAVRRSFQSGLCDQPIVSPARGDAGVPITEPEGYAYYAVYPELYIAAAEAVRDLSPQWTVVGIRSIGTSLGAAVAATLPDARFVTVRPTGHPFARELHPSPYEESILCAGHGWYAIVDEGPGLSGTSFASVASWLEQHGVLRERIVFFPSHAGEPGAMASDEHRMAWRQTRRAVVPFETVFLGANSPLHLASAFGADDSLQDVSAGQWRERVLTAEAQWPGVHVQQERRKYLFHSDGQARIAKFSGIGSRGYELFARSQELANSGFAPPTVAQKHGFMISDWIERAQTIDRSALFTMIARYLAFRAANWPAPQSGATAQELADMARFNTGDRWRSLDASLSAAMDLARPVVTDNRMHAWEWIATADGRILKADAVDHHCAHDLIGCQDIAWDLAGAIVELDATEGEAAMLQHSLERSLGRAWSAGIMRFYALCYLAFWYGYYKLAERSCGDEAPRLAREAGRYAKRLALIAPSER
jgi:hypothetical protein